MPHPIAIIHIELEPFHVAQIETGVLKIVPGRNGLRRVSVIDHKRLW